MIGSTAWQHRYTDVRLTSCTRRQASSPVVRIESSSGGEMPALWNDTSTRPKRSTVDGEEVLDLLGVAHVDGHELAVDLGRGDDAGVGVPVGDHDAGALGGQATGGGQPDAAATSGDHRDPTGEPRLRGVRSHGCAPSR